MRASSEFRERDAVDVAVLDALVERGEEGMTVFELRTQVDADIDEIEAALGRLKDDGLIEVENEDRTRILPDRRVVPEAPGDDDYPPSLLERLRDLLPF